MSSLRELQAGFRAALLADDERGVAPDVVDDGLSASARLAVYRHHVFTTLTAAMEATYPVVCRLVDRRFFGWIADQYVRVRPPAGPCLFEYGADFPEFVAAFPACVHLPWLADVARLGWAMNGALRAPAGDRRVQSRAHGGANTRGCGRAGAAHGSGLRPRRRDPRAARRAAARRARALTRGGVVARDRLGANF